MLNITHGVSIFDFWDSHAVTVVGLATIKFILTADIILVAESYHVNCSLLTYFLVMYYNGLVRNTLKILTFDDLKQNDVVLISALSRSTRCKPFSSVKPRYLPVVT